eukprot:CAMPEP_0180472604 /NCGR_PEP_ID=MMETSP1036_2-20121128/29728_1 /TAXON_ID=632150 /ORGANISM="Azadinium spinosum, Strain 3D9" /LENGTH=106 /DNA_ID=CAMNT_0022479857 /DNA_START=93 /DNA_END=409 /DNA_ORIENTATION=+
MQLRYALSSTDQGDVVGQVGEEDKVAVTAPGRRGEVEERCTRSVGGAVQGVRLQDDPEVAPHVHHSGDMAKPKVKSLRRGPSRRINLVRGELQQHHQLGHEHAGPA